MKNLKYYVLGAVTILFAVPICNQLMELISLWIETLKTHPSKKILNYEKDFTVLREFIKPVEQTFDYEVEYYGDDDFDE